MKCKIDLSPNATKDLQRSFEWYESQSTGLGYRFIEFVEKVLDIMESHPESFPVKRNSLREASIQRFPYLIVYEYFPKIQKINVVHIFNSYQYPKKKYSVEKMPKNKK
jgi:plasmid stabilization system protein ParE